MGREGEGAGDEPEGGRSRAAARRAARSTTRSPQLETRPLLRAMDEGERTGTGRARLGEAAAEDGPEAAPISASSLRQNPAADCLESPEARLLAENFLTEDFFFFLDAAGPAGGRSSMPDKEGEAGRAGRLEHTAEKGVPLAPPEAASHPPKPGTES